MTGSTGADVRAGRENAQAEIPGCRGRRRDPGREWSRVRTTKAREEGFQAGSAGAGAGHRRPVLRACRNSLPTAPFSGKQEAKASARERAWEGAHCSRCEERKPRAGRGVREDLGTRWGGLR